MSEDKKSHKLQILIALIGLTGAIGAAAIGNWDKIFTKSPSSLKENKISNIVANRNDSSNNQDYKKSDLVNWKYWKTNQGEFKFNLDGNIFISKPDSITIENIKDSPQEDVRSGACQKIKIAKYLGKRIKYSAFIKAKNLEKIAYIYAKSGRIYPNKGLEAKANSTENEWTLLKVIFDIPMNHSKEAIDMCFSLHQGGKIWIDNINWEVVNKTVPTTYKVPPATVDKPIL